MSTKCTTGNGNDDYVSLQNVQASLQNILTEDMKHKLTALLSCKRTEMHGGMHPVHNALILGPLLIVLHAFIDEFYKTHCVPSGSGFFKSIAFAVRQLAQSQQTLFICNTMRQIMPYKDVYLTLIGSTILYSCLSHYWRNNTEKTSLETDQQKLVQAYLEADADGFKTAIAAMYFTPEGHDAPVVTSKSGGNTKKRRSQVRILDPNISYIIKRALTHLKQG